MALSEEKEFIKILTRLEEREKVLSTSFVKLEINLEKMNEAIQTMVQQQQRMDNIVSMNVKTSDDLKDLEIKVEDAFDHIASCEKRMIVLEMDADRNKTNKKWLLGIIGSLITAVVLAFFTRITDAL